MKAIFQNEEIGDPAYDGLTFGGYALTTPLLKADYPGLRAIRLEDGTVILAEDLPDSYTIPPGGGGGGGDHADSDHADAFSPLGHTHAAHADSDHDDRFSLLAHNHSGTYVPTGQGVPAGGTTGQVLAKSSATDYATVWQSASAPAPQALDWLTDVATAGQASTNVLTYNGTSWVPAAVPASGHTHAAHADSDHDDRFALIEHDSAHDDRFSQLAHTHAAQPLDWLTDVATAGQTSTNVLTYNGTSWVPAVIPAQSWTSITGKPSTFTPAEHDTDHDDRFSLLAHTHAAHADSDHDDRFSLLAHAHAGVYAPVEHDTTHDDRFSLLAHTHAVHADTDHDDRFSQLFHTHSTGDLTGPGYRHAFPSYYTASTTFTKASFPSLYGVIVECVGGGGGGGGAGSSGAGVAAVAGGGAGGAYVKSFVLAASLAASAAITVGGGGGGGATSVNNGSTGGASSLALSAGTISAPGGAGGTASGAAAATGTVAGGVGSTTGSVGAQFEIAGGDGWGGLWRNAGADIASFGVGGGTQYGQINRTQASNNGAAGLDGKAYGGGGNGGFNYPSQGTAKAGGNGANGLVIITKVYGDQ